MHIVIITGRSGSGKSTALKILEDNDFYCIDNLPSSLIIELVNNLILKKISYLAISIDARNNLEDISNFPFVAQALKERNISLKIIYLDCDDQSLVKRFSESRRRHPLTNSMVNLLEALSLENFILTPINELANIHINTSILKKIDLQKIILQNVKENLSSSMFCIIESFAFKRGIDFDADLVFDARILPNPFWIESLKNLSGLDKQVSEFLTNKEEVLEFCDDILKFLKIYIPKYQENDRSYFKIAIGCTGGFHRSVFVANYLFEKLLPKFNNLQLRHRDINKH